MAKPTIGASLQEEVRLRMLGVFDGLNRYSDCRNEVGREKRLSGTKITISLA